ncbi:hypothetical protein KIW84_061382 [Lathyrus oleraceus]|uniref:Uncharacterized protein n=1 Tax=Pisum sativum TaxID=3888 RepID=A0A9D4W5N4_PEA|nr:hypothetical protein KIW84_061382 [Pisum sativum]
MATAMAQQSATSVQQAVTFAQQDAIRAQPKHFRYFRENVDENYKCERFEQGLRYEIKEVVEPLEICQFQALVEKCKKVERMKQGRLHRGVARGPDINTTVIEESNNNHTPDPKGMVGTNLEDISMEVRSCKIQQPGHFAKDCRAPRRDHIPSTNNNNDIPRPTAKVRVYHIGGEEASNASGLVQGECEIANKRFIVI